MLMLRRGVPPRVDDDLVAVAPFEVLRSDLALWREGLVDVLSSNLDGAGPLKTVPASVVVRNWQGRANVESAKALGTRSGARFVVIGHVIGAGADSARVTASVVDLVTGRKGEEVESRDATSHMDRVVDSLTVGILRDIGRVRPVSAVRRASIGSVSVPALRAFLEGEQFLRRTALDSARIAYERAMALDSNFALAHSHMSLTGGFGSDSTLRFHALRAGALNHGLAPRESLLISADSLRGATYAYNRDPEYWRHVQRLIATLSEATRRYAQDAEAWYRLADARFHFALGPRIGVSEADILRTFDRALMLDSAFEPAYIHTIELAFGSGDAQAARRYARAYFAHNPPDVSAVGTRLGVRLLDSSQRNLAEIRRTIDTASADLLFHAYSATRHSLDSAEVAVQLLRAMATVRHANDAALGDPAFARKRLALQLSYRGHLREAAALPETPRTTLYAQLALIGAVSPEVAGPVMAGWLSDEPRDPFFATPALVSAAAWWASRGDTTSLSRMRRRAEATLRRTVPGSDAEAARYEAPLADAYLALARHDTTEALRRFATLPDTLCSLCVSPRLTYGQLLAARGRYREAEEIFSQRISLLPSAVDVVLALEGARAAEKLGAKDRAARSYQRVALAWVHADPSVSSLVEEARAGLQRVQPESAPSHRP
jgi:tetratricopeptide (TPR) repeat protein